MNLLYGLLGILVLVLRLAAAAITWYLIWYYWSVIDTYVYVVLGVLLVGAIGCIHEGIVRDTVVADRARWRKIIARARTAARHRAVVRMTESSVN